MKHNVAHQKVFDCTTVKEIKIYWKNTCLKLDSNMKVKV